MIAIINQDGKDISTYRVQINQDIICEFTHRRSDGLAVCLEKAAEAVRKHKNDEWAKVLAIVCAEKMRP